MNAKHRIPITVPYLGEDEKKRVSEVIESGWLSQGPRVAEFEEKFSSCVGSGYAVATTSCTTALHCALVVSGIGPGDEVIVPSLSFIATANSVVFCGATPVFADIDPETCNIDPDKIEGLITTKTRAVMPVHQMGLPADLDSIKEIADRHGLKVIEDAACAVGAKYKDKPVGGHGNIACFSFHPRKIITTGEGGMVTTDDPDIASRLRRLRHQGMSVSDLERHAADTIIIETYPEIGYNYRMTDMQAAIGIEQLRKLDFIVERRRELAGVYDRGLGKVPHIRAPKVPVHVYHNYQSYWIELLDSCPIDRDTLMSKLLDRGIATRRGIMAIHLEPCYRGRSKTLLPNTERITMKTLLLPLYPTIRSEEQEFVIDSVREIVTES